MYQTSGINHTKYVIKGIFHTSEMYFIMIYYFYWIKNISKNSKGLDLSILDFSIFYAFYKFTATVFYFFLIQNSNSHGESLSL